MKPLSSEIMRFFLNQGAVIVSTLDKEGGIHNACKGIIKIDPAGKLFLLDLYHGTTYHNLKADPHISITAIDEHTFKGYCLQGKAQVNVSAQISEELIMAWEATITARLAQRILRNVGGLKGHPRHPEALLPIPKYLIAVDVERVIDLTPQHIQ